MTGALVFLGLLNGLLLAFFAWRLYNFYCNYRRE